MSERKPDDNAAIYLVGGGIASLAAVAFFIRDGASVVFQIVSQTGRMTERI